MTKKHFIALADVMKRIMIGIPADNQGVILAAMADFCQRQNGNFNRERWFAYIKGECGPNGGAK